MSWLVSLQSEFSNWDEVNLNVLMWMACLTKKSHRLFSFPFISELRNQYFKDHNNHAMLHAELSRAWRKIDRRQVWLRAKDWYIGGVTWNRWISFLEIKYRNDTRQNTCRPLSSQFWFWFLYICIIYCNTICITIVWCCRCWFVVLDSVRSVEVSAQCQSCVIFRFLRPGLQFMKSCWPRLYQVESHSVMMVEIIANILLIDSKHIPLSRNSFIQLYISASKWCFSQDLYLRQILRRFRCQLVPLILMLIIRSGLTVSETFI